MADRAGIFDDHHPPSQTLADDCVHCGFCLPTCPTYVLWGREPDSPRGRVYLIKAGLEGRADFSDRFQRHFDTCLGCMACLTSCPSGVRYDRLLESTRPQIERHLPRTRADRNFREFIFDLFPDPSRLRVVAWPLWLAQRLGLQALARATRLTRLLPKRLAAMERLTPPLTASSIAGRLPSVVPAQGAQRMRVGMLTGCVQRVFFGDVNAATARVLAAEGCEVHIPEQGCCGALMQHAGRDTDAATAARRLIDVFEPLALDRIVINAAGCGSTMKLYGEMLADDPNYAEKARAFAARCVDVSEILAELGPRATRRPLDVAVAYHDACHLQHAQRIRQQPRDVLKTIPGVRVVELGESELCCGSAGIYNLVEPDAAAVLRDRKVAHIKATGAQVLVSSNPGCLMQIASGLQAAGHEVKTMHLVELLDASISGASLT